MSFQTLAMLLASIGFLYFIFRNINKNKILFEHAFMWILIGFGLIIIALCDAIPVWLAGFFGFGLTSNFLLTISIFTLLVISFLHSIALSQQKEQIKHLVQEVSMLKKRLVDMEAKDEQ
ncbi:DUF2304 domain-containing protein [Streptococcus plurextorum]|uniref:DUF2304 domain-containing protein n=1 Tax=Streptococcus plurextorum TaxID=456876 RepID=UPI000428DEC5|nr:DUF2304 domain-containing protein [Streptococcus plurextorum]